MKIYDTLDAVPEPLRKTAIETKEGTFAAEERDEIGVLQTTLEKERTRANELEKTQRALQVERDQLKTERDARNRGATEEEITRRRAEIDAAMKPLQDQLAEKDNAIKEANGKLRQVLHIDRVRSLALAAGVMPDRINKAMKELKDRTDLTDDGKGLVVKDEAGNVLATRIEDFLERDFKAEAPYYYAGSNSSGSGARGSDGPPPPNAEREKRNQEQQAAEKRSIVSSAF
jgi:DNA-binding transcriptional regulator YhcF (GntR family)